MTRSFMHDPLDIFLSDRLEPGDADRLRRALDDDPELRRAIYHWMAAEDVLRERLRVELPPQEVLAAYALRRSRHANILTQKDLEGIEAHRDRIEAVERELASFGDICRRIADDAAVFEHIWQAESRVARPPVRSLSGSRQAARWLWRVPVTLAFVAFVVVAILLMQRDDAFEVITTGAGEIQVVELADGSTIRLMENSTLHYVPVERQKPVGRRAVLDGRALFDVTPQQRGLLVETPTAVARVVGTFFGIAADAQQTEVVIVEGSVALSSIHLRDRAVTVDAGQQSRVVAGDTPTTPREVDVAVELEWTDLFIFRSMALREIAARLTTFFEVEIVVPAELAAERITGTFERSDSVESILRTIAAAIDAELQVDNRSFRFIPG